LSEAFESRQPLATPYIAGSTTNIKVSSIIKGPPVPDVGQGSPERFTSRLLI
jgi:hypothetical protein